MAKTRARLIPLVFAVILLGVPASTARSFAQSSPPALEPVGLIPFQHGSHQELARINGHDYAFVATGVTEGVGELRVVDVSAPSRPRVVAKIPCGTYQGHIQLSHDKKTLILGVDVPSVGACMPAGEMGFATIDITDPTRPRPLGYASIPRGSHSTAAHPSKAFVYNGDGFPEAPGEMQVWSIKNPAKPRLVKTLHTGEHSPHDLSFNSDGTLAALASVSSLKLLDTTDPANPTIEFVTQCPGCLHTHEARFTPDGSHLVVNDEFPSAVSPCPGAALYFYEVLETPTGGRALHLVGEYYPDDVVTTGDSQLGFCTAHVFDISDDGTRIAASWHSNGLRYLDITNVAGTTVGTTASSGGARELASYTPEQSDMFSAKFHRGPYVYAVDALRGFEILRISR